MTFEECVAITEHLHEVLNQTVLEVEFLEWLAMNRRAKIAAGSDTPRQDLLVARILEEAAKNCTTVMLEASADISPGHLKFLEQAEDEINDEEAVAILDRKLPALLEAGFTESEITRLLASWRLTALNDKKRSEEKKPLDRKLAEILRAAASRVEMVLEDELGNPSAQLTLTPAARIFEKNPDLFASDVNYVELVKRLNRTGRNEPCPCASGKKFKKCCGV